MTGTQAATCTDEQSGLQTELEGPKGDHNAWSPFTFADTPEALRKIDRDVPFTALEDLVASGTPSRVSTDISELFHRLY